MEAKFLDVKEIRPRAASLLLRGNKISQLDLFTDYIKFPDMGQRLELGKEKEKTIQINRGLEGWTENPPLKAKIRSAG